MKLAKKIHVVAASAAIALGTLGCAATGDGSMGSKITQVGVGLLGAAAGIVLADELAKSDAKRLNLTPEQIEKRKRGYRIAFGLLGYAAGDALGGSIYSKLSAAGKRAREKALQDAAAQAQPQRYGEPTAPTMVGTVTPGPRYAGSAPNQECVDVEDTLSDGSASDAIFVKMCRTLPSGAWQPVTA